MPKKTKHCHPRPGTIPALEDCITYYKPKETYVFKGTLVEVDLLLDAMLHDETVADFISNYPELDRDIVENTIRNMSLLIQAQ